MSGCRVLDEAIRRRRTVERHPAGLLAGCSDIVRCQRGQSCERSRDARPGCCSHANAIFGRSDRCPARRGVHLDWPNRLSSRCQSIDGRVVAARPLMRACGEVPGELATRNSNILDGAWSVSAASHEPWNSVGNHRGHGRNVPISNRIEGVVL